jgi:hypothetical protein
MQRKKPQQRAFHGMVGLPPEPEPATEPVEQEQPEVSPAGEIEIATETARIEDSPDAKEIASVSLEDLKLGDPDVIEEDVLEEIETEYGTKIVKKEDRGHVKNIFGLKSTSHPVVPSTNPDAPFGFDENDRPIGMAVGKPYVRPVRTGTIERPKGPCKCERLLCMHCHPEHIARTRVLMQRMHITPKEDIKTSIDWLATFGPPAPIPSTNTKFPFFPEILGITRRTILELLDMTVAIEPLPVRKRMLKSRATVDGWIEEIQTSTARVTQLKQEIEEHEQTIVGLSAHAMKFRRDPKSIHYAPDNCVDTKIRGQLQREEKSKIEVAKQEIKEVRASIHKLPPLDQLLHRAKNWGESDADHEMVVGTVDGEVPLIVKFTLPRYFEKDHPDHHSLVPYAAFLRHNNILMDSSARLRGYPNLDSWRYLENEIVRQAISWKLVKPTKAIIDKYSDLCGTWTEEDFVQDDTENPLILKTGGAQIGASVYNFGRNASGSTRLSGNFDNTVAYGNKDGRGVPGEARAGSDSWTGDDDADSFNPD